MINIEYLGDSNALFVTGSPVAMLTDDELIELVHVAVIALYKMRQRRAIKSAAAAAHARRIAADGAPTRSADLAATPIDLELT